ncbi:MAG: tetratricopeptide repeat protein [Nitrospirae bacterium]|nr:tetratricopeptide repeat protein [Nitrospirota bacterium]
MRIDINSKHCIFHLLLIAVVGLLCYSNTFNSPFVFDDIINITNSPMIRDLKYFTGAFVMEDTTSDVHLKGVKNNFKTRYVGHLTFALNFKLNGLDVTGYHIFNLIVHISNAIIIYWFIVLIFKTPFFTQQRNQIISQHDRDVLADTCTQRLSALTVALLFVCHPVQTQAVTYIVQRFASLATFFYLFSIVIYIKSRLCVSSPTKLSTFAIALAMAILAMKTKEISFTLPIVIVMIEFMFFPENSRQRYLYLIPLLLTMLIIPITLIRDDRSLLNLQDIDKAMSIASAQEIPRWDYLFTQFRVIVTYMRLLLLPINQNLDYDYPVYRSFFNPEVLMALVLIISTIGVGVWLYLLSKKSPHKDYLRLIAFAILWFFVTISVESSIIPIADVIFEHRLYLPSVGAFIAITAAATLLVKKIISKKPAVKKIIFTMALFILAALSIATYVRNIVWQDKVRLWADVVKKSPNKPRPRLGLADAYADIGFINDAIRQYRTVIDMKPDYADAHMSLSRVYAYAGQYDEAVSEAQLAMKYYKAAYVPGTVRISYEDYFARTHFSLGNTFAGWGRMGAALDEFLVAISLKPDYAQAYVSAGNVYATWGQYDEAIKKYQTALEIQPGFSEAQQNLLFVLQKKSLAK